MSSTPSSSRVKGFSLIELLVVIGIIAVLIAILLPTLQKARLQSQAVKCQANLKQLFNYMVMYASDNKEYLFPVGPMDPGTGLPTTLGTNVAPHQRWIPIMFNIHVNPYPYQSVWVPDDAGGLAAYRASENTTHGNLGALQTHMALYDSRPFTPPVMLCPSDIEPLEGHSYVVNQHLVQRPIAVRYTSGSGTLGGRTVDQVIVAGEKRKTVRDYYMERADQPNTSPDPITGQIWPTEFERVVEPYRHGISYGSNYLFLDGHVSKELPKGGKTGLDPWYVPAPPATPPTTPPTP